MYSKKRLSILLSTVLAMSMLLSSVAFASADFMYGVSPSTQNAVYSIDSVRVNADTGNAPVEITGTDLTTLKSLTEGTIISRFQINQSGSQSLIGLSNGNSGQQNTYFHLYAMVGRVGFEIRRTSGGDIAKYYVDAPILAGEIHTVAMTASSTSGYTLYLDGASVLNVPVSQLSYGYGFLSAVPNINKGFIGKTYRATANNGYLLSGDIYYLSVYDAVLDPEDLKSYTSTPTTSLKSNEYKVFDKYEHGTSGTLNSNSFRIPSLITTDNDVMIAAADIRYGNSDDSPNNIDIGIRRSLDQGVTWEEPQLLLNFLDYPNVPTSRKNASASFIDSVLIRGNHNRIFLLSDAFRGGVGSPNSTATSGYVTVDGVSYLALYNTSNKLYTVRENGNVYDSANQLTAYQVTDGFGLLENGTLVSNIFYGTSPLKVAATSFIVMIYSDDDGATWSSPRILNDQVKANSMRFLGMGPGVGINLQNDPQHAGRILAPTYFDTVGATSTPRGMMIYSDDNGETWHAGEPTPIWLPGDGKSPSQVTFSEMQVVEMPDGQVKLFSRTAGRGKTVVATSFDGGVTFENPYFENQLIMSSSSGCQLSVINYSKLIDGKPVLIFSNPASSIRSNGVVRVGFIEESGVEANGRTKYTFDWAHSTVVRNGEYAYSILTELANGNIGLLCEEDKDAGQLDYLKYSELSIDSLTNYAYASLNIQSVAAQQTDDGQILSVTFDGPAEIFGQKTLKVIDGTTTLDATYLGKNEEESTLYFKSAPTVSNTISVYFDDKNTEIIGMFGSVFSDYSAHSIKIKDNIVFSQSSVTLDGKTTLDRTSALDAISSLDSGTVIIKFKTTDTTRGRKILFSASRSTGIEYQSSMSEFSLSLENGYVRHDVVQNGVRLFSAYYPKSKKINDNQWHTFALVSSSAGNKMYLDNQDITVFSGYTQFANDATKLDSLQIGGIKTAKGMLNQFIGQIDFIKVLDTPLTQAEIFS